MDIQYTHFVLYSIHIFPSTSWIGSHWLAQHSKQCYCKLPAIPWITINIIINTAQYLQFFKYNGTHTLACTQCTVPGLIHTMSPGSWSNRYTGMLWDWSSLRSGHQDPNSKIKRFNQPVDVDTNPQNSPLKKVTLCLIKWMKYNQTLILWNNDNLLLT